LFIDFIKGVSATNASNELYEYGIFLPANQDHERARTRVEKLEYHISEWRSKIDLV
jgi:hypothetical protein